VDVFLVANCFVPCPLPRVVTLRMVAVPTRERPRERRL
jgi:hypothetical protein